LETVLLKLTVEPLTEKPRPEGTDTDTAIPPVEILSVRVMDLALKGVYPNQ